jgi:sugar transferase (PEP-CTERM/EpsH1 system associated)
VAQTNTATQAASSAGAALLPASTHVPLIVHFVYRLDVGGLENGLVNLINALPPERFRHAIVCLTDYTDFRYRIKRKDVVVHALHKRPGKDVGIYLKIWRLLRELRPDIVHTRNLATLDCQIAAAAAGVRCRLHGEHGRDMIDLDGSNRKYNLLRRMMRPLVHHYIPLSCDLEQWLQQQIRVPARRMTRIYNGVDGARFHPARGERDPLPIPGFAPPGTTVIGTVGRMQEVKDPLTLVRAFLELLGTMPGGRDKLRLVLVGDGPLRAHAAALLDAAGAADLAWLPGSRDDVPELMRALDLFVLPSLAEGISNTILEAMATGLPVVATHVGGNAELVVNGVTGRLVPPADPVAMAKVLQEYVERPERMRAHGRAARARIEQEFTLEAMVQRYMALYNELLAAHART